ncbi:hypothetical protein APHAL10511_006650 [Amanita phalloides]|nr:hypothetical protein APHAL10511_006650 [Amanita phalloides]
MEMQSAPFDAYRSSLASSRPVSSGSSTHPMLADARLDPPVSPRPFLSRPDSPSGTSLTVNYIPSKFPQTLLSPGLGPYRRKVKGTPGLPKVGGGVDAFRSGETRIGNRHDEDYNGIMMGGYSKGRKKLKWTRFKWILFIANVLLTCYSVIALIACLLLWFNVFKHSDVILTANQPELVSSTIAAVFGVFTSTIGWAGIILNNRAFLAVYCLLSWITFGALVIPGYLSYKRHSFNLEGKINSQWSRDLGTADRLRIQNELRCCGYYSPYVEATITATCYSRSVLPGCKSGFLSFQRLILKKWYTAVFGLVPAHIFVMFSGLLCANHVTYRFGKGLTPKAYRLDMGSVATIMDHYATELAEQYGVEVADNILKRSNLNLSTMSNMPLMPSVSGASSIRGSRGRYDSIGGRMPEVAMDT